MLFHMYFICISDFIFFDFLEFVLLRGVGHLQIEPYSINTYVYRALFHFWSPPDSLCGWMGAAEVKKQRHEKLVARQPTKGPLQYSFAITYVIQLPPEHEITSKRYVQKRDLQQMGRMTFAWTPNTR